MVKIHVEVDVDENIAEFIKNLAVLLKTTPEKLLAEILRYHLRPDNIENQIEVWVDEQEVLEKYGLFNVTHAKKE